MSTKTIRRRITDGVVKAEKQKTSQGYRWLDQPRRSSSKLGYVQSDVKEGIPEEWETEIAILHQQLKEAHCSLKVKAQQIQELHALLRDEPAINACRFPKALVETLALGRRP